MRNTLHDLPLGLYSFALPRQRTHLHAMLTSCGHETRLDSYDWDGLRRGNEHFVLLQHTLAGQGRLRYEEREWEVGPGQTILLTFPHNNRYWLPPDSDLWEFVFVCANGRSVTEMWQEVIGVAGPLVTLPERSGVLETVGSILAEGAAGELRTPYRASAMAYNLAMELAETLLPMSAGDERPGPIRAAIRYGRQHLAEPIGVEDLARVAGYTRAHFTRLFTAAEGIAPGEYLRRLRMEHAISLLRDSELSVEQIASRCGYNDGSYFCKVFRAVIGTAPESFRHSGMY